VGGAAEWEELQSGRSSKVGGGAERERKGHFQVDGDIFKTDLRVKQIQKANNASKNKSSEY